MGFFDKLKDNLEAIRVVAGDQPTTEEAIKILTSNETDKLKLKKAFNVFSNSGVGDSVNKWFASIFNNWHQITDAESIEVGYELLVRAWYETCCANNEKAIELFFEMLDCEYAVSTSFFENAIKYTEGYINPDTNQKMFAFEFYSACAYYFGWGVDKNTDKAKELLQSALSLVDESGMNADRKDYLKSVFNSVFG